MPGSGKYSATVNGTGLTGRRGNAAGPRSFSMLRCRASRIDSPCRTRPDTSVRVIWPVAADPRSRTPTWSICPMASTRAGTASTYRIGTRERVSSSAKSESQPGFGSGVRRDVMVTIFAHRLNRPRERAFLWTEGRAVLRGAEAEGGAEAAGGVARVVPADRGADGGDRQLGLDQQSRRALCSDSVQVSHRGDAGGPAEQPDQVAGREVHLRGEPVQRPLLRDACLQQAHRVLDRRMGRGR